MCRVALSALIVALAPVTLGAWGFDAHRFVTDRALALLPAPMRPFYDRHRVFIVEHSVDPDLWRNAGFTSEPPRHFLDLDAYGAYPFADLPRDYDAAVRKFGRPMIEKNGLLPWRTAEMVERLAKAFRGVRSGLPYGPDDVKFFSAVVAHYVGDAHVPFHAVVNYDGQLTNQHGIHSRFETELFNRYRTTLSIAPQPRPAVTHPRDFVFDTLLAGSQLVDSILAADRRAVAGKDVYDDQYFEQLLAGVRPILERRLAEAISGVAAIITGAWEQAGKPDLPPEPLKTLRKVRPTK